MTDRLERIEHLIEGMFVILDRVEMSDEGSVFHTTKVDDIAGKFSSVRVHHVMKLSDIVVEMKEWLEEK